MMLNMEWALRLYGMKFVRAWTGIDAILLKNIWCYLIRSKHNDLLNYFVHDKRDLSRAYVKSCEKFLKEISDKQQATSVKLRPQLNDIKNYES